ncbi:MAG TPA: hypothetical protein VFH38_03490 [Jatrophihabitans sp.]|nr:hypothetical protein [Jatrophihabitans sp.]
MALVVAATCGGGPVASAHALPAASESMCGHNQHQLVQAPGGKWYQIRNPYWRGSGESCIRSLPGPGFRVLGTPAPDGAGRVVAYPDIFRGCIWNICTPNSNMPIQVSAIERAVTTWHISATAAGTWNASYDIWFGKHAMTQGHADGAELMIFIREHGGCCALHHAPQVRVGRHMYWLINRRRYDPDFGLSWNYIQFRRVHPTAHVDHLRLEPFLQLCERLGVIRPSWWMENVEAGFEVWSGGRGLATTNFAVTVDPAHT